jgi:hypothetical protein
MRGFCPKALAILIAVCGIATTIPAHAAIQDMIFRGVNIRDDAVDDLKDLAEAARANNGIVVLTGSSSSLGPFIRAEDVDRAIIVRPGRSLRVIPNSGITNGLLMLPNGVTARGTILMQPSCHSKLGTLIMPRGLGIADGRLNVLPGSVFIEDEENTDRATQVAVRSPRFETLQRDLGRARLVQRAQRRIVE